MISRVREASRGEGQLMEKPSPPSPQSGPGYGGPAPLSKGAQPPSGAADTTINNASYLVGKPARAVRLRCISFCKVFRCRKRNLLRRRLLSENANAYSDCSLKRPCRAGQTDSVLESRFCSTRRNVPFASPLCTRRLRKRRDFIPSRISPLRDRGVEYVHQARRHAWTI